VVEGEEEGFKLMLFKKLTLVIVALIHLQGHTLIT
jgi:hypothetical protein